MKNYGIVTLPMVAAILFCGLLTTHASAKSVVGRRSVPESEMPSSLDGLLDPEVLLRTANNNGGDDVLTSGSALSHFLHRLQRESEETGSRLEQQNILAMLQELRMRLGPHSNTDDNPLERRRTWDKRLEILANDGTSMADGGVLAARRRMGPEFNPTGW